MTQALPMLVGTDRHTMKGKIMSAFFHSLSTNENPLHRLYGDWCLWQKAEKEGRTPEDYDIIVKQRLKVDKQYEDRIRTVFHELSTPELLDRCLKGKNQNKNEALHSKIWYHHNKAKFTGLKRVNFLTQLTLLNHNFGYVANTFLQHLGCSTSSESLRVKQRMEKRK